MNQFHREARSSSNARVSRDVQAQVRVRASSVEGRLVKIIAGPYCGLTGRIESCIPGNWYLVSQVATKNKFDLDYIIHARNLQMIEDQQTKVLSRNEAEIITNKTHNEATKATDESLVLPLK